jgi:hypothetical protein
MQNRWILFWAVVIVLLIFIARPARAAEESLSKKESLISGSVEFIGSSDSAVWLYAERKVTENWAVYINAAKFQKGFQEVTFGPTYYLKSGMQVGVSLGLARHMDMEKSRLSVSTFWYWKTDKIEAEATVERHSRDPVTYYRVYAQTPIMPISKKLVVGFYGEQGIGWGPRILWSFNKNVNFWLTPLVERQGGNVIAGGLQFTF